MSTLEKMVNFHDLQVKKHERIFDDVQLAVFRKRIVPDRVEQPGEEFDPVKDSRALGQELSTVKTPTSRSEISEPIKQVVVEQKSSDVSNLPEPSMDKHRILFKKLNDLYLLEEYTPINLITHNLNENQEQQAELISRANPMRVNDKGKQMNIFDVIQKNLNLLDLKIMTAVQQSQTNRIVDDKRFSKIETDV